MRPLERAARAACMADGHDPDGPVCDIYIYDDPHAGKPWAGYRDIARAVLLAVREATPKMVKWGHVRDPLGCDVEHAGDIYPPVFAAMIDAILEGE